MSFVLGTEHALVQLAASLTFADTGAAPSVIRLYADIAVATGAVPAGPPLAEIVLSKPCGAIAGGQLTLNPADLGGSMVTVGGIPRAARWLNGEGLLVAAGTVTDPDHIGDFRVAGGATAAGDDAPSLYAGGKVLLGAVVMD